MNLSKDCASIVLQYCIGSASKVVLEASLGDRITKQNPSFLQYKSLVLNDICLSEGQCKLAMSILEDHGD